jgi:hypothetical protein
MTTAGGVVSASRSEVFTVMKIRVAVFWVVTPCSDVVPDGHCALSHHYTALLPKRPRLVSICGPKGTALTFSLSPSETTKGRELCTICNVVGNKFNHPKRDSSTM